MSTIGNINRMTKEISNGGLKYAEKKMEFVNGIKPNFMMMKRTTL